MYFIGIMDNYGRIMVKLWALSTIIDDYEVFFKKTHNKDIIEPQNVHNAYNDHNFDRDSL